MLEKEKLFIGIDGGGTKTAVRIEDAQGRCLGTALSGPGNIRLSVATAWASLLTGITAALAQAGLALDPDRYALHVGLGLAGTEDVSACQAFLACPHPFTTLTLRSDAYSACLGAHAGADGAIIIIGTGTVGLQIEGEQVTQVGGWGFPLDDVGAGSWLGLQCLRAALRGQDGRAAMTPLLRAVLARFADDPGRLVAWSSTADATGYAGFAPLVVEYAADNDPVAVTLMQRAAAAIDATGAALARQSTHPLPCSLLGGLAALIEPWLGAELRARLRAPRQDACVGALTLARRAAL